MREDSNPLYMVIVAVLMILRVSDTPKIGFEFEIKKHSAKYNKKVNKFVRSTYDGMICYYSKGVL